MCYKTLQVATVRNYLSTTSVSIHLKEKMGRKNRRVSCIRNMKEIYELVLKASQIQR